MRPWKILVFFLFVLFLAGCGSEESSDEQEDYGRPGVGITDPGPSSTTSEQGASVTRKFRLTSSPLGDVTLSFSSSDATEGSVSPASITFTKQNWETEVALTVSGINDSVADGSQDFQINVGVSSQDASYSRLIVDPIKLTNEDDEIAGIILGTLSGNTAETGSTANFTVSLSSEPLADVTVPVSSSDPAEGTVSPSSLTFTSSNWSDEQTVTASGEDDEHRDGDITYRVNVGPTSSSSAPYNSLPAVYHSITNTDNETSGVTLSTTSISTSDKQTFRGYLQRRQLRGRRK